MKNKHHETASKNNDFFVVSIRNFQTNIINTLVSLDIKMEDNKSTFFKNITQHCGKVRIGRYRIKLHGQTLIMRPKSGTFDATTLTSLTHLIQTNQMIVPLMFVTKGVEVSPKRAELLLFLRQHDGVEMVFTALIRHLVVCLIERMQLLIVTCPRFMKHHYHQVHRLS